VDEPEDSLFFLLDPGRAVAKNTPRRRHFVRCSSQVAQGSRAGPVRRIPCDPFLGEARYSWLAEGKPQIKETTLNSTPPASVVTGAHGSGPGSVELLGALGPGPPTPPPPRVGPVPHPAGRQRRLKPPFGPTGTKIFPLWTTGDRSPKFSNYKRV